MFNLSNKTLHQLVIRAIGLQNEAYPGFFKRVSETLELYKLFTLRQLLENTPTKLEWKRQTKQALSEYWSSTLVEEAVQNNPLSRFLWQLEYWLYPHGLGFHTAKSTGCQMRAFKGEIADRYLHVPVYQVQIQQLMLIQNVRCARERRCAALHLAMPSTWRGERTPFPQLRNLVIGMVGDDG